MNDIYIYPMTPLRYDMRYDNILCYHHTNHNIFNAPNPITRMHDTTRIPLKIFLV